MTTQTVPSIQRVIYDDKESAGYGHIGEPYARYRRQLPTIFGSGSHQYQVIDNWARRPRGTQFGDVPGVAVDANDNVFVAHARTIDIYDSDGYFLDSWGEGNYAAHAITIDREGSVWLADSGGHMIRKFTPEGRPLLTLGTPNQNAPRMSGLPFNKPTRVAVAPNGDLYISDGYGNDHVHVFAADGEFRFTFGGSGSKPGQLHTPHSVVIGDDGRVFVSDRLNNRIAIFDLKGTYISEWRGVRHPDDIAIGRDGTVCIVELQHRMSIWSLEGERITGWGDEGCVCDAGELPSVEPCPAESLDAGMVIGPHAVAMDSQGSIYVGELADGYRGIDRGSRSLQKFVRVV